MSLLGNFMANRKNSPRGEMAFTDHIEDLRWHIIRSLAVIMIAAIAAFVKIEWIFEHIILGPAHKSFISYTWFCELSRITHIQSLCLDDIKIKFQNTTLAGQFVMSISVSFMLGFVIAFPYVLWQLWKFIKPALKPTEIRAARGMVFWCSLLFFIGILFAYYIIAPYTINFFAGYQLSKDFENIITMDNYYETMSDLVFWMGIVFELPIIVYFLSRIGVLTPKFMKDKRRYAVLILFVLSEMITPPDWFSCFLVFIPLYILYELSVIISGRAMKERAKKQLLKDLE